MNIKVENSYYCANTLGLISNDAPLKETSRLLESLLLPTPVLDSCQPLAGGYQYRQSHSHLEKHYTKITLPLRYKWLYPAPRQARVIPETFLPILQRLTIDADECIVNAQ